MSDKDFNCKYKTSLKDYQVIGKGTKEKVSLVEGRYQNAYSEWSHLNNLKRDVIRDWRPCQYFHQLNIALAAGNVRIDSWTYWEADKSRRAEVISNLLVMLSDLPKKGTITISVEIGKTNKNNIKNWVVVNVMLARLFTKFASKSYH